jgi:Fe-S-cluster-containing dehydrogenase component
LALARGENDTGIGRRIQAVTQKTKTFEATRRTFLRTLAKVALSAAAFIGARGILCVEACKIENGVHLDAHHFRTWVERYVYLEGEKRARVDSQSDPQNIAASGSQKTYRFDNRYKDKKVTKAFFVPKICNHCENPSCVQVCPTGATFRTIDGAVLIDHDHCIGCQYCVQACPYGARFFNYEERVTEKCTLCYHRITKGLKPACVEVCPVNARIFGDLNDPNSDISRFIRDNRVQVLKPHTGNLPNCYYSTRI